MYKIVEEYLIIKIKNHVEWKCPKDKQECQCICVIFKLIVGKEKHHQFQVSLLLLRYPSSMYSKKKQERCAYQDALIKGRHQIQQNDYINGYMTHNIMTKFIIELSSR